MTIISQMNLLQTIMVRIVCQYNQPCDPINVTDIVLEGKSEQVKLKLVPKS